MAYKRPFESVDSSVSTENWLSSMLLDEHAHFSDSWNETTATAKSRGGHTMSVTFWVAVPPKISFFSVHCPQKPDYAKRTADFTVLPHVVGAADRFVCLRAQFFSRYGKDELFMYKAAGRGKRPSLDWIPLPFGEENDMHKVRQFGIYPSGRNHYFLAALCGSLYSEPHYPHYKLHVYSSEKDSWETRILVNPCPMLPTIIPEKVFTPGEGLLYWADLSHGMLISHMQHPSCLEFIPLPVPLPEHRVKLNAMLSGDSPRSFCDINCFRGRSVFIEMEHHASINRILSNVEDKSVLRDSELVAWLNTKYTEKKKSWKCWRVMIWSRSLGHDKWVKRHQFYLDNLRIDESTKSSLLYGPSGQLSANLRFRDMCPSFPTLDNDFLYLKCVVYPGDKDGWVVAVDLKKGTIKALEPYAVEDFDPSKQGLRASTLFSRITPGIETSVYPKIAQAASCANNTSVHVDESTSRDSRNALAWLRKEVERQDEAKKDKLNFMLMRLREGVKRMQNEAQGDHVSQVEPIQTSL